MKALAGVSIPDESASQFVRLLRWVDESYPGSTIQVISDAALPISPTSAPLPLCPTGFRPACD